VASIFECKHFGTLAMAPLRISLLVPSAPWRWLLFDFDDKQTP